MRGSQQATPLPSLGGDQRVEVVRRRFVSTRPHGTEAANGVGDCGAAFSPDSFQLEERRNHPTEHDAQKNHTDRQAKPVLHVHREQHRWRRAARTQGQPAFVLAGLPEGVVIPAGAGDDQARDAIGTLHDLHRHDEAPAIVPAQHDVNLVAAVHERGCPRPMQVDKGLTVVLRYQLQLAVPPNLQQGDGQRHTLRGHSYQALLASDTRTRSTSGRPAATPVPGSSERITRRPRSSSGGAPRRATTRSPRSAISREPTRATRPGARVTDPLKVPREERTVARTL